MEWDDDRTDGCHDPDRLHAIEYIGLDPRSLRLRSDRHGEDPQAYAIVRGHDVPPLRVHFHQVDQFQYIARGAGRLSNHELVEGIVHYADKYTPYGPLRALEGGLTFLTLRATPDVGASFMPESRAMLRERLAWLPRFRLRRSVQWDLASADGGGSGEWVDLHRDDDGLRVAVADLAASSVAVRASAPGAYLMVVAGSVTIDGRQRGPRSLGWISPGDPPAVVHAEGPSRVALLQFPLADPGAGHRS